jgi:lipid II:glycine glycyltransferase (peptidoglycan interpeptide bridge formation enzyme)
MNAPALLFWKVFERCRESGCKEFNLGGVPAAAESPESLAHGLFRFKSGFGGRRVRLVSGTTGNLQSLRGALISMMQKGRDAWKSW